MTVEHENSENAATNDQIAFVLLYESIKENDYLFVGEAIDWIVSRGLTVVYESVNDYDKTYTSSAYDLFKAIDSSKTRAEGYRKDKGRIYKKLPKGIWANMGLEPGESYNDPVFSPVDDGERRDDGGTVFLGNHKWCGVRLPSQFVFERWPTKESHVDGNHSSKGGRPNKQGTVLKAYQTLFPNGHEGTVWKDVTNRLSEEIGFSVSETSIRRVLGLKK